MTPQLQQAIRLLQLSTLELRQEMIEQLYNNPLLEIEEDGSSDSSAETDQSPGRPAKKTLQVKTLS